MHCVGHCEEEVVPSRVAGRRKILVQKKVYWFWNSVGRQEITTESPTSYQ
jgi:hypothetical protein